MDAAGASGDERDNQDAQQEGRSCTRHTSDQLARLEALFEENQHPDEGVRRQIARELGLEPKQIKFWFQNKRTQKKTQHERENNNALRAENERMQKENLTIKETLKSILCPACGGPSVVDVDHEHSLRQLKLENKRLKDEHEKVSKLLARYVENPLSEPELQLGPPSLGNSYDGSLASSLNSAVESVSLNLKISAVESASLSLTLSLGSTHSSSDEISLPKPKNRRVELERALVYQAAKDAKEELTTLVSTNEPLWVKSPTSSRRLVLHPSSYEEMSPRANHCKTSTARVESSKDSRIVRINTMQLVDMILDPDKWTNLFSTIISKALTLEVLEKGLQDRHGTLQLMYEEMHILSPLVPPREFFFLRYCQQVEANVWVIADVSFDYMKEDTPDDHTRAWKRPSGCMIQGLPNGASRVTWVEHVEVDDTFQTHRLYRDLVTSGIAYGAERWLMELQRMCDRIASASSNLVTSYDIGGVITLPEGRRTLMRLSQRMVRNFCGILNMSSKLDFPQNSTEGSNGGVRISIRRSTELGHPTGMIVVAATSVWLPFASQHLFDFFRDARSRVQWDALCGGHPVQQVAHVSSGTHPGNYISIIRSANPAANTVLITQETFIHPLGSYIIYTPISVQDFNRAIHGGETSIVPLLPSGITISEDGQLYSNGGASSSSGHGVRPRGSLLTVSFQLLMQNQGGLNVESVASANALITSTVQNIKNALNCPGLEY